jgi:hypothetical protein
MKKLICLLLLGVMFAASYPTIPHEFESKKIIPASWLNDNNDAIINGITDGTAKINVNEIEINGSKLIGADKGLIISSLTITGNQIIEGTLTVVGSSNINTSTLNVNYINADSMDIGDIDSYYIYSNEIDTPTLNVNTANIGDISITGKSNILDQSGATLIDIWPNQYKLDTDVNVYSYYTPSATSNVITMEGRMAEITYVKDSKENIGTNRPTVTVCFPVPANTTFDVKVTAVSGSGFTVYRKWGK